jgi:hypothetical protein
MLVPCGVKPLEVPTSMPATTAGQDHRCCGELNGRSFLVPVQSFGCSCRWFRSLSKVQMLPLSAPWLPLSSQAHQSCTVHVPANEWLCKSLQASPGSSSVEVPYGHRVNGVICKLDVCVNRASLCLASSVVSQTDLCASPHTFSRRLNSIWRRFSSAVSSPGRESSSASFGFKSS